MFHPRAPQTFASPRLEKTAPSSVGGFVEPRSCDPFCSSADVSSDHGEDELPTEGAFEGHQEAVNAVQVHNGLLYTCSGDRSVRAFDLVVSGAPPDDSAPRSAPNAGLVADSQVRGRLRGPRLQSELPAGVGGPVPASPPVLRLERPNHPLLQPEGDDRLPRSASPAQPSAQGEESHSGGFASHRRGSCSSSSPCRTESSASTAAGRRCTPAWPTGQW